MKKILISLILMLTTVLCACNGEQSTTNRIYVFSQPGCMHCQHAKEYMDKYYKNYDIKDMNIHEGSNMGYMLRYARKHNISQQSLGTPLIIMGDNYVMGWGDEQQRAFNRYARNFKPQKNKVKK